MTTTKENYKGLFPYWLSKPVNPSNVYVFFHPGYGQDGPADGSKLDNIINGPGWLNWVKSGREYSFNIIAPQFLETSTGEPTTSVVKKYLPEFVRTLPEGSIIILSGWSYGASFAMNWVLQGMDGYEDNSWVTAVVDFAGKGSGGPDYAGVNKPICLVSGTNDMSVSSYKSLTNLYNLIISNQTAKVETLFITIQGGDHDDAPRLGTDEKSEYGKQVIDFIGRHTQVSQPEPVDTFEPVISATIKNGSEVIFTTEQGAQYKTSITKV